MEEVLAFYGSKEKADEIKAIIIKRAIEQGYEFVTGKFLNQLIFETIKIHPQFIIE